MAQILEKTSQRLAIKLSSSTLTLDRADNTATLQRKMLFWSLKPVRKPLADVTDVTVDTAVDRASGVEVCHLMLVMRAGDAWALAENDKKAAEETASTIKKFLGEKDA